MFASFVLKVIISKGMFFDEIVFKVTSAMVMMLTKLSLFLEAVFSGCLCLSVRFVRKDFYCGGNSVFMQEIIIERTFILANIVYVSQGQENS